MSSTAEEEYLCWLTKPIEQDGGGFYKAKPLGDGIIAAIRPLLFHWTMNVCVVGDLFSIYDRWCYANKQLAEYALDQWNGKGDAPVGWHRHPATSRRRPDGDPVKEYIDP
jgi:hypothetical protein